MIVPGYGRAPVLDRGGAIKSAGQTIRNIRIGNTSVPDRYLEHDCIDLLFPTHARALRWGRHTLTVWVKEPRRAR
jgi:3D (Asp-Asp-Asp) domain-containing protein